MSQNMKWIVIQILDDILQNNISFSLLVICVIIQIEGV